MMGILSFLEGLLGYASIVLLSLLFRHIMSVSGLLDPQSPSRLQPLKVVLPIILSAIYLLSAHFILHDFTARLSQWLVAMILFFALVTVEGLFLERGRRVLFAGCALAFTLILCGIYWLLWATGITLSPSVVLF